ncbi:hypothetical protein F4805DRAFT_388361 [Annulohypoxylon moriforme]|nr:hypothetical protein F4805DRAFT_388361 [Annulohypoxylon moriforme]
MQVGILESELAIPPAFLRLGHFSRVHIWRVAGVNTYFGNNHQWLQNIRELRLVCTFDAKDIFEICASATHLENLSLAMTQPRIRRFPAPVPLPGKDISSAIALRAHTLKALEFRATGKKFFLGQISSSGFLECLPNLKKLEKLTTEIPLIYDFDEADKPKSWFMNKLPPNIVSLELIEWPTLPPDVNHRLRASRNLANPLLHALATTSLQYLPRLRRIHYLHSIFNPYYNNDELKEKISLFDPNIISFTWASDSLQCRMGIRPFL